MRSEYPCRTRDYKSRSKRIRHHHFINKAEHQQAMKLNQLMTLTLVCLGLLALFALADAQG
jgi:hypothetical protein